MSWGSWFKDGSDEVKEKIVEKPEARETHWLRSVDDDKQNHTHVVMVEKENGHTSAHCNGPKNER